MKKLYDMWKNMGRSVNPVHVPDGYPYVLTASVRDSLWQGSPWKAFQLNSKTKA